MYMDILFFYFRNEFIDVYMYIKRTKALEKPKELLKELHLALIIDRSVLFMILQHV